MGRSNLWGEEIYSCLNCLPWICDECGGEQSVNYGCRCFSNCNVGPCEDCSGEGLGVTRSEEYKLPVTWGMFTPASIAQRQSKSL